MAAFTVMIDRSRAINAFGTKPIFCPRPSVQANSEGYLHKVLNIKEKKERRGEERPWRDK
jgi:hypothetical protein